MIVQPNFIDHWKTKCVGNALGGKGIAIECILRLWSHCQHQKTDRIPKANPRVLAAICDWSGDPQILWDVMLETFCEKDGQFLVAHGYKARNSQLFTSWSNGKKGGRPVSVEKPTGNPRVTRGKPNPSSLVLSNSQFTESKEVGGIEIRKRLNVIMGRPENKIFNHQEERAFEAMGAHNEQELCLVEKYYTSKPEFPRRSLATLLENWNGESDKSRAWEKESKNGHSNGYKMV